MQARTGWLVGALGLALLAGCGPDGECRGAARGALGGDTRLFINGGDTASEQGEGGRHAQGRLDYGDGAVVVVLRLTLPLEQDRVEIPFGEDVPARLPQDGQVDMLELSTSEGRLEVREGTLGVRLAGRGRLEGDFHATLVDGRELACTFDVSGRNDYIEDELPPFQ